MVLDGDCVLLGVAACDGDAPMLSVCVGVPLDEPDREAVAEVEGDCVFVGETVPLCVPVGEGVDEPLPVPVCVPVPVDACEGDAPVESVCVGVPVPEGVTEAVAVCVADGVAAPVGVPVDDSVDVCESDVEAVGTNVYDCDGVTACEADTVDVSVWLALTSMHTCGGKIRRRGRSTSAVGQGTCTPAPHPPS